MTPRPRLMGVVNATPDSFSDAGRFYDFPAAKAHAERLAAEGADILDLGGESTRPGAGSVPEEDEIRRVVPLIEALTAHILLPVSIDTMKPRVARAAMAAGASIWNDVNALRAPGAVETAAALGCEVVLMHMQGEPRSMQDDPRYDDVVADVSAFLLARAEAAMAAGVARTKITLDPGIGFGKTPAHNLALVAGLGRIKALGFPVLLGVSRKRFIRSLDPSAIEPGDRLGGSLAAALAGAAKGADILRVHDVRETAQALKVWSALRAAD